MKKNLTIQALPNRLQQRGVSEKILSHPAIAFANPTIKPVIVARY